MAPDTSSTPGVCTWSTPPPNLHRKVKERRTVQMNKAKNQDYTFRGGKKTWNDFGDLVFAGPLCQTADLRSPSAVVQAPVTSTFHPPSQSAAARSGVSGLDNDLKTTGGRVWSKKDRKKSSVSPGSGTGTHRPLQAVIVQPGNPFLL